MKTDVCRHSGVKQQPGQAEREQPFVAAEVIEQAGEEVDTLHASIKVGTVAQIVIALIATLGLLFLLKLVLVAILASILLAYVLEPVVALLVHWRSPRWLAAMIVIATTVLLALGTLCFSYNRVVDFADQLPHYSSGLRRTVGQVRARADKIVNQATSVVEPPKDREKPVPVRVEKTQGVTQLISQTSGTILDVLMATSFVPFLAYFMLASKEQVYRNTVRLFPKEHRLEAHRTVGTISATIRSYVLANLVIGVGVRCFMGLYSGTWAFHTFTSLLSSVDSLPSCRTSACSWRCWHRRLAASVCCIGPAFLP